jgi:class 3 adenylate cyclase
MSDIDHWLENLGLGQYASVFAENKIDLNSLPELEAGDLREMDIPLGPRKILLKHIASIHADGAPSVPLNAATYQADNPVASGSNKPSPSDAERRQLTVMFCDMVGSTELSTKLDAEDYREVMRAYQDACAGVIARFDGYVARFMGDGVLAYFGWPRAHEDDAARAINAGLGVVEAVEGLAPANGVSEPLSVRIGIATGPVVIGDIIGEAGAQEAAVVGETPNLAARLEKAAPANSVVVAGETQGLARGLFEYESLGEQELKGFEETIELWRVVGERQVESRFVALQAAELTSFTGREEELELVTRRWRRAQEGEGQVVLLVGEPGIGKSRLTRAVEETIGDEPHTRLLFQCSPHHTSSALYPVIGQLELAAGITPGDDAGTRLGKLESIPVPAEQPADEVMALLAALLSIPADDHHPLADLTPQQQKDRTLAALVGQLEGLSADKPVLFVFEDAHWIDPTSLEFMELVVERVKDLPVLMIITYRPEFSAPWVGDAHVSLHALKRLTRRESMQMVTGVTGEQALSDDVLTQIAERTDGVPLFIEELTRSVLEADGSQPALGGAATNIGVAGVVPASLQDALEARFDRSPAVREVAQVGAAIGREFAYDLLAQISSLDSEQIDAALADLAASGLILARGTPPDASFTFKHALIQDTAYDAMVRSTRQDTHRRIAEALSDLRPEITETSPQTLAHHYTEANLLEDAVDWWTKAGQAASARSANPEAVELLERGLALIPQLPEGEARDRKELTLQTALFGPLISVKGQYSSELESARSRVLEIGQTVQAPQEVFRALFAKSLAHGMRGEHLDSKKTGLELIDRAKSECDEGAELVGYRMTAMSSFLLGEITEAKQTVDLALSKYDRDRHNEVMLTYGQNSGTIAHSYNSTFEWILGRPEKSRSILHNAVKEVLALDHVGSVGPVLSWGGTIGRTLGRDIENLQWIDKEFEKLIAHHKMPIWEMMGRINNALCKSIDSPSLTTARVLESDLIEYESMTSNAMVYPAFWGVWLAENYIHIGEPDRALAHNDKGVHFADQSDERWAQSELYRVRGVALAMRDGVNGNDEAESWLRRAIEDARSREAKSFELRASMSLARFLRDQSRHTLARETLAPVYGWFTEGFDTPDLVDAKALLNELS